MTGLVVQTPRTTGPLEVMGGMLEVAEAWYQRYAERFESFGLFPGAGGYGVIDVADEAELHRIVGENPFSPFVDTSARCVVDGATGWRQSREIFAARTDGR